MATALYFAHTLGVAVALAFLLAEEGLGPEAMASLLLAPLELLLLGAWAGQLADRRGYAQVVILGAQLPVLGEMGLTLPARSYPLAGAVAGLFLLGVGRALFQAATNAQVPSLAPPGEEALASGALSVARPGSWARGLLAGVGLQALAGLGPWGGFAALTVLLSLLMRLSLLFLSRGMGKGHPSP